jgi:hypothetical protein
VGHASTIRVLIDALLAGQSSLLRDSEAEVDDESP